ncbi:ATP-binding protein [Clostridium thermarum]|uniref:ATP-binding protein n=1 Tax=Clostridium thermarum TaxID=1716543 RepID=UPI0013D1055B|nr:ATP-binding protein [Clostridium thermarum]
MFVGREFELAQLNKLYDRGKFQLIIVYGRQKVGKTALVKEFCKDKPTLYYVPEEHNEVLAFNSFRNQIINHFDIRDKELPLSNWEEALKAICVSSEGSELVLVLDEFPYLVKENPSLPSIIQKVIEQCYKQSKIYLIIVSSSNGYVEKELLNSKSALYTLRNAQLKIEPFNFFESSRFFPKVSITEKIVYYSTLGGIPQYLLQFDYSKDYEQNLMEYMLNKTTYLYAEPEVYLKSHIEDINFAHSLLSLLSKGDFNLERFNYNEPLIVEDLITMLKKLRDLNIISRNRSVGRSTVRPWSYYHLEDNFFRFWYRFIYKNRNLIEMNMKEYLYQNKIKRDLNSHIGYVFEKICRDFLIKYNAAYKLPFVFESIGSWVGYNPALRRPSQLDIVAVNSENVLIGECKWNNSLLELSTIQHLIKKTETLKYDNKYYCFFSKCGYDEGSKAYAKENNNVFLFTLEDIENLL